MKVIKQKEHEWVFELSRDEADCLCAVVSEFPLASLNSAIISRTDSDPKAAEREKLLNESLAEHRAELQRKARYVLSSDKWKTAGSERRLRLNAEEREILLQILNGIRVECWRALGEPENLEMNTSGFSGDQLKHYHCMHLAGFFEHHLLDLNN